MQNSSDILVIILSVGFVVLIVFVCITLGFIIRILLDVKGVTKIAKEKTEDISNTIDDVGAKTRSFFSSTLFLEKVVPAIMGAIGLVYTMKKKKSSKNSSEDDECEEVPRKKKKSKKKKTNSKIFVEEEID